MPLAVDGEIGRVQGQVTGQVNIEPAAPDADDGLPELDDRQAPDSVVTACGEGRRVAPESVTAKGRRGGTGGRGLRVHSALRAGRHGWDQERLSGYPPEVVGRLEHLRGCRAGSGYELRMRVGQGVKDGV